MKKSTVFLIFCLTVSICNSQTILAPEWIQQIGSVENGSAQAWDVDVDEDGMVYWPVNVDSSLTDGVNTYTYKFDNLGEAQWEKPLKYGGPGGQFAFSVNADGPDLYIGGRQCIVSGFSCDMQIQKIDKEKGTLIWDRLKDFGNNGYDEIDGLEVKEDGIYIGGWAQAIQTGVYQLDIGLWKLDYEGNTEWFNHYGEANTAEHQDGHFVVDDDFIYAGGLYGGKGVANLYNGHSFIGKFSKEDGSFVDETLFGPQSNSFLDIENVLGMTSDGTHFYLTGYTTPDAASNWETFVAKFDKDLNQIWITNWGGTGSESARGITVHDGIVYVAGLTESSEYSPGGKADALLLVMDTDGNYISYHTWGDELDNTFRDVAYHDNALYLSGASGNGFANEGSITGNLMKVKLSDIISNTDEVFKADQVKIYPNPSDGNFVVEISHVYDQQSTFQLFTLLGEKVFESTLVQQRDFSLDLESGLYFYFLYSEAGKRESGRIIFE